MTQQKIHTSQYWYEYYKDNLTKHRVDWSIVPQITEQEMKVILKSLKAWQLGETSDGAHLLRAATKYAKKHNDTYYPEAVKLFIKEEQKHGGNLGRYLDVLGEQRVQKDWGDSLFRSIRYFNTSMELWTLSVITVESTAQIFYKSLHDATGCTLLKAICSDILIDESAHIDFQFERMITLYNEKSAIMKLLSYYFYVLFYYSTIFVVWYGHRQVFKAGGNTLKSYIQQMHRKFELTIQKLK